MDVDDSSTKLKDDSHFKVEHFCLKSPRQRFAVNLMKDVWSETAAAHSAVAGKVWVMFHVWDKNRGVVRKFWRLMKLRYQIIQSCYEFHRISGLENVTELF